MKNVLKILCVGLLFLVIALAANANQNRYYDTNTRKMLISDIENNEQLHTLLPDLKGDYLVTFTLEYNHYNFLPIDPNLSLVDGKNYGKASYYKENDYQKYLSLVAKKFNVNSHPEEKFSLKNMFVSAPLEKKFNEYIKFNKDKSIDTNMTETAKAVYKESQNDITKVQKIIENNGKGYKPEMSSQFVDVFSEFGYDTGGLVDKFKVAKFNNEYFKNKIQKNLALGRAFITVVETKIKNTENYYFYENLNLSPMNKNIKYPLKYKDKILEKTEKLLKAEEAKLFEQGANQTEKTEEELFQKIMTEILKDYQYLKVEANS